MPSMMISWQLWVLQSYFIQPAISWIFIIQSITWFDIYCRSSFPPASLEKSHTRAQSQSLIQTDLSHELQARDRELTEIAKSIASLAELFKDLSVLVIDQGTLLDSVEFNIEQTAVHMEDSVKELTIGTRYVMALNRVSSPMTIFHRYQKNTGKRKCIFLLLLIIFGLIVVLIFKPKGHRTAPPPPTPIPNDSVGVLTNMSLSRRQYSI